jgi:hypothetical protein
VVRGALSHRSRHNFLVPKGHGPIRCPSHAYGVDSVNPEIPRAAGLFEGEGSITHVYGRKQLRIQMTDYEVLERILEIFGVGTIYGPYTRRDRDGCKRKPTWIWVCEGPMVSVVFRTLAPWLSTRRRARAREIGVHFM